jgi:hypothetical protein
MTCAWPVDRSCLPTATSEPDKIKQQAAEDMAVSVLWALSGRQFGVCPVVARPCPVPCAGVTIVEGPGWTPIWTDGQWRNVSCGCTGQCSYAGPSVVHLPGPAVSVTRVDVGRVEMPKEEYVLEGGRLYRTHGGVWPSQNLLAPLPETGTWAVYYERGVPVPPGVDVLVGLLAQEFLNACSGGKCRLPRRVQTLSRQGVSYQMIDPTDIYASGKTGIPEIDIWLASVNPHHVLAAPSVR